MKGGNAARSRIVGQFGADGDNVGAMKLVKGLRLHGLISCCAGILCYLARQNANNRCVVSLATCSMTRRCISSLQYRAP